MIPKPSHIIDKVVTVGFVDLLKMFLMVFQDIFERFAKVYQKINAMIQARDTRNNLYLIVNSDYGFTMQPAVM